ncbi:MAG TPA: hypothetical protein VHE81_07130 [Lacipirellulaceae bacterium]|nr:hypothetical protein [Lacipirellulaceae bacterium]
MQPVVDIEFDCLPLRSVARVDVPLDASPIFRTRCENLRQAIAAHGADNAYFLYNTRCSYRLANSDIDNMLRFSFDGIVKTDRSDCKAERADLDVVLIADTCRGVPSPVVEWFRGVVVRAVLVEFDRFIAAGQLAERVGQLANIECITDVAGFAGMNV